MLTDEQLTELEAFLNCRVYYDSKRPEEPPGAASERPLLIRNQQIRDLITTIRELRKTLEIAYRALTDGMADVPPGERDPRCAALRAEAKRAVRKVLELEID
jgi:hypothetical protein